MIPRPGDRRAGFTLTEVLVATVIMGLGMASSVSLMRWVLRATDMSGRITVANAYAQAKIDELSANPSAVNGSDQVSGYTRTWTVANYASPSSDVSLRQISVSASYVGIDTRTHTVQVSALITP